MGNDIDVDMFPAYTGTNEKGNALFSAREFRIGDELFNLLGEITKEPSKYTVHLGNGLHILDERVRYMNHSFKPNCKFTGRRCYAIRDIGEDDELTFDYTITEEYITSPFKDVDTGLWVR